VGSCTTRRDKHDVDVEDGGEDAKCEAISYACLRFRTARLARRSSDPNYDGLGLWSQFHFGKDPFFLLHSPHPTRRHSSRCGHTRRYHTGRVLLVDIVSDILHVASFSLRYSPPSTPPPSSSLTWYSFCRIVHLTTVSGLLSRANHVTKLTRMVVASYSPSYSPRLTRYRPRHRRCHQHRTRHVYWPTSHCFCHSERYANHVTTLIIIVVASCSPSYSPSHSASLSDYPPRRRRLH
jgi:hypothetical protein